MVESGTVSFVPERFFDIPAHKILFDAMHTIMNDASRSLREQKAAKTFLDFLLHEPPEAKWNHEDEER